MDHNGRPPAARVEGGGTGSARRRRAGRFRSFLHHERKTVAMAVADGLHHSAYQFHPKKKGEMEKKEAPRGKEPARTGAGAQHYLLTEDETPSGDASSMDLDMSVSGERPEQLRHALCR